MFLAARKMYVFGVAILVATLVMGGMIGATGVGAPKAHAVDTDNFYFDDFTADYYLTRDDAGVSHLRVVESLTAIFPLYNQNKGICREIPFTNMDGTNVTMEKLNSSNLKLTRNGLPEPIYSIDKERDFYRVCTGTEDYVTGHQVYTFEYEFDKVISDFSNYQELYWDTNGNGWYQRFNTLTARVHFGDEATSEAYDGKKWCYVGAYGISGQDRCTVTELSDGLQFATSNLSRYENLTFDIQFKAGSFAIPEPTKNYLMLVYLALSVIAIVIYICLGPLRQFRAVSDKRKYYEEFFVKPEYQPNPDYNLMEMAEIYIGKKKSVRVPMLLDMIIKKRITLIRTEKKGLFGNKDGWKIKVNSLDGIREQERTLLQLINGGKDVSDGIEFEIEKHEPTVGLLAMSHKIGSITLKELKRDKLVESNYGMGSSDKISPVAQAVSDLILGTFVWVWVYLLPLGVMQEYFFTNTMVGKEYVLPVGGIIMFVTVLINRLLRSNATIYTKFTKEGLKQSRYMDGLKLYISMAEADRLKMLQSVKGADVSPEGVVRLYEKLLPYAAVFGLEDSWVEEMKNYCEVKDIELGYNISTNDMLIASRFITNDVLGRTLSSSGSSLISGGGGSSSGFSGGGGGGFSGGGGGGGGGGGR